MLEVQEEQKETQKEKEKKRKDRAKKRKDLLTGKEDKTSTNSNYRQRYQGNTRRFFKTHPRVYDRYRKKGATRHGMTRNGKERTGTYINRELNIGTVSRIYIKTSDDLT